MSEPITNEALGSWLDVKAANLTFACHPRDVCCPDCEPHYAEAERFREAAERLREVDRCADEIEVRLADRSRLHFYEISALTDDDLMHKWIDSLRGEKK